MAVHKLLVDDFYDPSFSLIAIHCRLEDYRLAYLLNKNLGISLVRMPQDLDYKYLDANYSIYQWEDEQQQTTWNLISNVCKKEVASLQSSGSLFSSGEKMLKTYHLLPELKKVDFFLKITSDDDTYTKEGELLQTLQQIPQLITSYSIDTEQIKSKDNLIF
ncbi:MAG: IPExxxVDY family protein [Aquaticitalea sp.]